MIPIIRNKLNNFTIFNVFIYKIPCNEKHIFMPLISRKLSQQDLKTAREVHYQWSLILLPIYSHWLWSFSWAQSLLMWASLAVCSVLGAGYSMAQLPMPTDPESCSLVPSETPIQAVSSATGTVGCFSLAFFSKWEIMRMFWRYFDFFSV